MDDTKILDASQIVNGIAVLLSFFVGYKYAIKRHDIKESDDDLASGYMQLSKNSPHNYKMVLVVRNDLKMGKGKLAAQCSHGAVDAYKKSMAYIPNVVKAWESRGCAKIALKVESEAELIAIKKAAEAKNLITCLIRDAGRTQIEPNTKTVVAIGPAAIEVIDQVTGHLSLL